MNIRALQLGSNDLSRRYRICPDAEWHYEPKLSREDREYDIAVIDRKLTDEEADILSRIVRAYCLFVTERTEMTDRMDFLMISRCGRRIGDDELRRLLEEELPDYYGRSYGEKFDPHMLTAAPGFHGSISWHGFTEMVMEGRFGEQMRQAAFWRTNIPVEKGQAIDLWLEYEKNPGVTIELEVTQFVSGSVAAVQKVWKFSEDELQHQVTIENTEKDGPVFVAVNARGSGTLKIIALHDRYSRHGEGTFLPGGRRLVTEDREELFTYLDPGDLKPPLCVYFSGYKTQEGFEGYRMMRRTGCPFLLISDARLEGGGFYIGSPAYEELVSSAVRDAMKELGFTEEQVIFSGLSMGTFGALYYATGIRPAYIIVGKPLVRLGQVAEAERIDRPDGFPTSLDVLWKEMRSLDHEAAERMNRKFWEKFDNTDWSGRTFYIAYMIEDDYDAGAYQELLTHMRGRGASVIGEGLTGRHNDNTSGIVSWFIRQYRHVIRDGFDRKQAQDGGTE